MNIQELLNNNLIDQNNMIKLVDLERRETVLDKLQNIRLSLTSTKTIFEELLKDTYNHNEMNTEYKNIKALPNTRSDYSFRDYYSYKFDVKFYGSDSLISIDAQTIRSLLASEQFLKYLYHNNLAYEYWTSTFEINYVNLKYYYPKLSLLASYRKAYKDVIESINEAIEFTMKIEMLLVRLHNELIDNPNALGILKMAAM